MESPSPLAPQPSLPPVSELWRTSWKFFTEHLAPLVKISLIMLAPSIINQILALITWRAGTTDNPVVLGLFLLFGLLSIITGLWGSIALLTYIKNRDANLTISQAFNQNVGLLWPFFWVGLVTGLITLLAAILLIIPGIIVGVYYSFYSYVMVDQQIRGFQAAETSWQLVKNRWWAVVGRLLVIGLIGLAVYLLTWLITKQLPANAKEISALISLTVNVLFSPLAAVYTYRLYDQLKATLSNH